MKALFDLMCQEQSGPPQVQAAMQRMQRRFSEPAKPLMTQEAFEALPRWDKCVLTCNVIGCGSVVSTHGLVCVEHGEKLRKTS